MKKLFLILGFISATLAVLIAVTPLSKLAFIPGVIALLLGIFAMVKSKSENSSKTSIQLIFLMTIIALALTTYKTIYSTAEVGNTEELTEKEKTSEEEAIKELEDLELDDIELE
ncbi:MAG: FUSC family protein [Psychroserpens sp.]|nr:FUSC family protein [Psychroserpens sp.]